MEEFVDFYDEQKVKDYFNKIRNKILNGLDDLRKEDYNLFRRLISEETNFLIKIFNEFKYYNEFNSNEKGKKLNKLFEIYKSLDRLIVNNYMTRNEINHIESLVNGN